MNEKQNSSMLQTRLSHMFIGTAWVAFLLAVFNGHFGQLAQLIACVLAVVAMLLAYGLGAALIVAGLFEAGAARVRLPIHETRAEQSSTFLALHRSRVWCLSRA